MRERDSICIYLCSFDKVVWDYGSASLPHGKGSPFERWFFLNLKTIDIIIHDLK